MGVSTPLCDFFVVCGVSSDLSSTSIDERLSGLDARYKAEFLERVQAFSSTASIPPQLPVCCLPEGVDVVTAEGGSTEDSTKNYPIVLTGGEGSKVYVACLSFLDAIGPALSHKYRLPKNARARKCLCLVSQHPYLGTMQAVLQEVHRACFSPAGCLHPLPATIQHILSEVPLPSPGGAQVLFTVESRTLCARSLVEGGRVIADLSLLPLVQSLDARTIMELFTAVLLERRVLLRASQYSHLTSAAEAVCQLIYPFRWQHVYVPVLPEELVDYLEAPATFLMGLHSRVNVDDSPGGGPPLDGVVVVDLDANRVEASEPLPALPEPEGSRARARLVALLRPALMRMDAAAEGEEVRLAAELAQRPWGRRHDAELRSVFLELLASVLRGYGEFVFLEDDERGRRAPKLMERAFLARRGGWGGAGGGAGGGEFLAQLIQTQAFFQFLEEHHEGAESLEPFRAAQESLSSSGRVAPPLGDDGGPGVGGRVEVLTVQMAPRVVLRPERHRYECFPAVSPTAAHRLAGRLGGAGGQGGPGGALEGWRERSDGGSEGRSVGGGSSSAGAGPRPGHGRSLSEIPPGLLAQGSGGVSEDWVNLLHTPPAQSPDSRLSLDRSSSSDNNGPAAGASPGRWAVDDGDLEVSRHRQEEAAGRQRAAIAELMRSHPAEASPPSAARLQRLSTALLKQPLPGPPQSYLHAALEAANSEGVLRDGLPAPAFDLLVSIVARLLKRGAGAGPHEPAALLAALTLAASVRTPRGGGSGTAASEYLLGRLRGHPMWSDVRTWEAAFGAAVEGEVSGNWRSNRSDAVLRQISLLMQGLLGVGVRGSQSWALLEALALRHTWGSPPSSEHMARARGRLGHLELLQLRRLLLLLRGPRVGAPLPGQGKKKAPAEEEEEEGGDDAAAEQQQVRKEVGGGGSESRGGGPPRAGLKDLGWGYGACMQVAPGGAGGGVGTAEGAGGGQSLVGTTRVVRSHGGSSSTAGASGGPVLALDARAGVVISSGADRSLLVGRCPAPGGEEGGGGGGAHLALHGHQGAASCLELARDGSRALTGGTDSLVVLWDAARGAQIANLRGHRGRVSCVRILDERRLLSAADDGLCRIWDVRARTGSCAATLQGHTQGITCVGEDESGHQVVTGSRDRTLRVWDVRVAGRTVCTLAGHRDWVTSLAVRGRGASAMVASGSLDWTGRVWAAGSGACEAVLGGHGGGVSCVHVAAGGGEGAVGCTRHLSQAGALVVTGSADRAVRLWARRGGKVGWQCVGMVEVHSAPLLCAQGRGGLLLTAATDSSIGIWRAPEIEQPWTWQPVRTQHAPALARCATLDEGGGAPPRVLTGGRDGAVVAIEGLDLFDL